WPYRRRLRATEPAGRNAPPTPAATDDVHARPPPDRRGPVQASGLSRTSAAARATADPDAVRPPAVPAGDRTGRSIHPQPIRRDVPYERVVRLVGFGEYCSGGSRRHPALPRGARIPARLPHGGRR